MATVIVHTAITLDGFLAAPDGGVDWMFGRPSAPEDDELLYGGTLKVPVHLKTHAATNRSSGTAPRTPSSSTTSPRPSR